MRGRMERVKYAALRRYLDVAYLLICGPALAREWRDCRRRLAIMREYMDRPASEKSIEGLELFNSELTRIQGVERKVEQQMNRRLLQTMVFVGMGVLALFVILVLRIAGFL